MCQQSVKDSKAEYCTDAPKSSSLMSIWAESIQSKGMGIQIEKCDCKVGCLVVLVPG